MSNYKWLIDAGHGGMKDGKYTTAPSKMHTFEDGFTVYEGVNNREIAKRLMTLLDSEGIDYALVYDEKLDTPLTARVAMADKLYAKDKRCIYLSIHSDAMPPESHGKGNGLSVYTSKGQTKSDKIAEMFCQAYMKLLSDWKFRRDQVDGDADKEEDFYVLRKTDCPAVLVENLFFDNRREAEFLTSEDGQQQIAEAMFYAIKMCETLKPI